MRVLIAALILFLVAPAADAQPVDRDRLLQLATQLLDAGADGSALAELGRADDHTLLVFEQLGPENADIVRGAWESAFDEDRLRGHVTEYFASTVNVADSEAALEWLRRADVSRATDRMRAGTGSDFNLEFGRWAMELEDDDIDMDRLEWIELISERSGQELIGQIQITMAEAGIRGGSAVSVRDGQVPLDEALNRLRTLGPTIEAQAISQNRLYLYYVLRDLSADDLRKYAVALDTAPGRWYVSNMAQAFLYALNQASDELVANVRSAASRG